LCISPSLATTFTIFLPHHILQHWGQFNHSAIYQGSATAVNQKKAKKTSGSSQLILVVFPWPPTPTLRDSVPLLIPFLLSPFSHPYFQLLANIIIATQQHYTFIRSQRRQHRFFCLFDFVKVDLIRGASR
jgi:hypothetical protein